MSRDDAYAVGEHAPVEVEHQQVPLSFDRSPPGDLSGTFARNSGNPAFPPRGRYHWFDGDGHVHAVRFEGGAAWYTNRAIDTVGLLREREAGQALWGGVLAPHPGPDGRPVKDTANTDLVWHNGRLLATWWLAGQPYALDLPSLTTRGPFDFDGTLPGAMGSHAKVDPRSGELVFFAHNMVKRPYYHYGVAAADGRVLRYEGVDLPHAHIPHDITLTERYSVLLDLPLGWEPAALRSGRHRIGFMKERPARIGVMPRLGQATDLRWFELDPFYCYHTINAYEAGDEIVLDGCRILDPVPEGSAWQSDTTTRLDNIRLAPELCRWRLNLKTGLVRTEVLDDQAVEFPRINDAFLGAPYRYCYAPRIAARECLLFDGLIKYDLRGGSTRTFDCDPSWYTGEPVFVARPGATEEDDGWLVTIVTSAAEQASCLLVLDASEMRVISAAPLPHRIPTGFHAAWAPA